MANFLFLSEFQTCSDIMSRNITFVEEVEKKTQTCIVLMKERYYKWENECKKLHQNLYIDIK
jgi:hypothetical protein